MLVPADQVIAGGSDGSILAASPWVLNSASVRFDMSGVAAGNIVSIRLAAHTQPAHFAVVSVGTNSLTFRRVGMLAGQGMAPATTNLTGLTFSVPTFRPQIEDVSYDLNRRYGINDDFADRTAAFLYDPRELRQACVLTVLLRQYATESRTKEGDFAAKIMVAKMELDEVLGRISVRFGELGQASEPTNRFSTRVRR
jgi:hypothetical protein